MCDRCTLREGLLSHVLRPYLKEGVDVCVSFDNIGQPIGCEEIYLTDTATGKGITIIADRDEEGGKLHWETDEFEKHDLGNVVFLEDHR